MKLHRLKIRPRSPWRTPWQADTLTGMLLATAARLHGADALRQQLIEPMLAGAPPFVLSDACPTDLLPAPISIRFQRWPTDHWKSVKRVRWITRSAFERSRRGESVPFEGLYSDDGVFLTHVRQHNTLSRLSDTTGDADAGLGIFNRPEYSLLTTQGDAQAPHVERTNYLSIYVRTANENAALLLFELFDEMSLTGFGADVATGRGQFEILGPFESVPDLDTPPDAANAVVSLSTFQPARNDPTQGFWDAFPKFGKLGPDLRLANKASAKNTLIMFRPGACFRTQRPCPWLGRAIPTEQLLPQTTADELIRRGVRVIHPAFALCVPALLSEDLVL